MEIQVIRFDDTSYRVYKDLRLLGHVNVWYERNGKVNNGRKRFAAVPFMGPARIDCETFSSAQAYLLAFDE